MNYIQKAYNDLNLDGTYYTPKNIVINTIIGNPPFKIKKVKIMSVYVDYLDCKNKYMKTRKNFETYEKAWKWITKTFDNPTKDLIKYY
jgi:hypothetical protein